MSSVNPLNFEKHAFSITSKALNAVNMRLSTRKSILMMKNLVMAVTIENQTVIGLLTISMNR